MITMDTLPWIALIKYHCQAHQHTTEVMPPIGMIDPPLGIIVTPDVLTMITKTGPGLVIPNPAHIPMDIGIAAIMTPIGTTPDHSTDLPNVVSHATEAQAHAATAVTHHTTDLHHIDISPKMTADPNHTNPKHNITNWHKDLHQAHKQHHGKIDRRHKQVTIDDPPSKYYSSDGQDSDSKDDLN